MLTPIIKLKILLINFCLRNWNMVVNTYVGFMVKLCFSCIYAPAKAPAPEFKYCNRLINKFIFVFISRIFSVSKTGEKIRACMTFISKWIDGEKKSPTITITGAQQRNQCYLVITPAGKVYVPVMQTHFYIPNSMGKVKANITPLHNNNSMSN